MKRTLLLAFVILSAAAVAQRPNASPVGTWKGESLCTVKPNACHDETVVYEIKPSGKQDRLICKADKIVDGKRQWMGDLDCTFANATLTCEVPKGTWSFTVQDNTMTGTLKLADGTLFRKVNVRRQ